MNIPAALALSAALVGAIVQASAQDLRSSRRSISYHKVDVRGLEIFYREAGPIDAPTVLLLHGFPSSSRMWEPLMPLLADKYHLIAPDYPGFGNSSAPPPSDFIYTFDNIAAVIGELTTELGLTDCVLFMQDYGGPVGFRMALAQPEHFRGIIVQNAVSHEQGLSPLWNARRKYWADPAHELEALKANFTSLEATRQRHLGSSPRPERYDPDTWIDRICLPDASRPSRDSDHAVPGLPDQRRLLSEMAGLVAPEATTDAGGLGQIRSILHRRRRDGLSRRCAGCRGSHSRRRPLRAG
ncbi:pimeloyl-ACP methyl ester carboxylesterase [Bradyrhizobium sp. LB7.1]